MKKTGSALQQVLELEKYGQERINAAKNESAQRVASAEKDRDNIILKARSEAMMIRSAEEKKARIDIDALIEESAVQREKTITSMIARYSEIEESLAQSIARRLIHHES